MTFNKFNNTETSKSNVQEDSDIDELSQDFYNLRSGRIQTTLKSSDLSSKSLDLVPKSAQNILKLEYPSEQEYSKFEYYNSNKEISDLSLYALAASSYIDTLNEGTFHFNNNNSNINSNLIINKAFKEPELYKEAINSIYKDN